MKTIVAKAKNVRGSAQKARIPAMIVKGMTVTEALPILEYMPKSAAKDVYKVVNSAKANAVHNNNLDEDNLFIKDVRVDKSASYRRMKAGSRGGAIFFHKHFCHITVELGLLSEVEESKEETKDVKPVKKEAKTAKAEVKEAKAPKKKVATKKSAKSNDKK